MEIAGQNDPEWLKEHGSERFLRGPKEGPNLQTAFEAARASHPTPHQIDLGDSRRFYWFVDGFAESGNPALRGQLVLREERSVREFNVNDRDFDDWRVQHPRNHWGFTIPAGKD